MKTVTFGRSLSLQQTYSPPDYFKHDCVVRLALQSRLNSLYVCMYVLMYVVGPVQAVWRSGGVTTKDEDVSCMSGVAQREYMHRGKQCVCVGFDDSLLGCETSR